VATRKQTVELLPGLTQLWDEKPWADGGGQSLNIGGGQDELVREAEAGSPRGLSGHASTSDSLNKLERGPESPK